MEGPTTKLHREKAPLKVKAAVITVSDSKHRFHWTGEEGVETEDISGKDIIEQFTAKDHEIVFYCIVPDHEGLIVEIVDHIIETYSPDALVLTGGTGIGPRDVTIEAMETLFDKTLDGFGEFFRKTSMEEIGSAAMLSRASAGLYDGVVIFCLPGSPDAVRTGTAIILKEINHLVKHARE